MSGDATNLMILALGKVIKVLLPQGLSRWLNKYHQQIGIINAISMNIIQLNPISDKNVIEINHLQDESRVSLKINKDSEI